MRKLQLFGMIFLLLNLAILPAGADETRSREALRSRYLCSLHKEVHAVYDEEPSAVFPYAAGSLSEEAVLAALDEVNFIRYLAGLDPVQADGRLNDLAQHSAVLMAANGSLSHSPRQPSDMEDAFYIKGETAASSSNLIMLNWFEEDILTEAVRQFALDDGEGNRYVLGHRRWLLYPQMKYTGFGLAQDEEGRSYAAMYVMDASEEQAEYDMICWPPAGAFPAEYMSAQTPWSVSLNPEKYDLDKSALMITLTEQRTGARFIFDTMEETASDENQYFVLGGGRMGDGPAYIFRPDLSEYDELMYGYSQNQIWSVMITGVFLKGGALADPIEYTVEMASLTPIEPAAVEISEREITLKAGESISLSAEVIPDWADDLSIIWKSSDETVAAVGEDGEVLAKKAGKCTITAESVNGRYDEAEITVTE